MQYEVASTAALWAIFDLLYLVALHWCIRLDFHNRVYTSQEEVLFNDINLHIPSRRLDPSRESRPPHTGVSIPHGRDVPPQIIKMSRPLTRETSTHLRHFSTERVPQSRHSSTERVTLLRHFSTERVPQSRHSSTERVTLLRHFSTERVPHSKHFSTERVTIMRNSSIKRISLLKHSSTERNPLLRRSSTKTSQLNRMSPLRHLFTEMYYYNRCFDLLRKSLTHATINWCHRLDFKKRYSKYLFWADIISQWNNLLSNSNIYNTHQFSPETIDQIIFSPLSFILSS
jgi:hypothetical protein